MARLLVIDDESGIRSALAQVFEYEGHEVREAEDGHEGIELAESFRPDVIFLDVKMPGLDGFEVLERLRKDHRFSSVPVIMLTSMGQEADIVRAFRMGADDYVLKPFSPTELSARVRRLLTRGRSASSL